MLIYNFARIFKARGIDKPFGYLKKAGFSDSFSSKLKNNNVSRLDLKILERLCIQLRCTPNDILEWTPNDNNVDSDHPINKIKKNDKVIDITKTLNSVPLHKLDEIEKLINEQINNST